MTEQCLLGMPNDCREVLRTKLDIIREKIPSKKASGNAIAVLAMQHIQDIFKNSDFGRHSFIVLTSTHTLLLCFISSL